MEDSKPLYPHHESLTIENFTCFEKAEFQFSPGINVFVGENGTGKTHVLKILCAVTNDERRGDDVLEFQSSLESYFNNFATMSLKRELQDPHGNLRLHGLLSGSSWSTQEAVEHYEDKTMYGGTLIFHKIIESLPEISVERAAKSVFIPTADVISNVATILKLDSTYRIDWDQLQIELAKRLNSLELKNLDEISISLVSQFTKLLGGELEYTSGKFWLKTNSGTFRIDHVADGHKKIATLLRLIQVGALQSGSCLFWDEPEANLNPSLMDEVVRAILLLARSGVQVFLATHSYIILKELEVQALADDQIKFFGFEKTDNGTKVHEAIRYRDIKPNLIEDQYGSLLERAFEKDFKRGA